MKCFIALQPCFVFTTSSCLQSCFILLSLLKIKLVFSISLLKMVWRLSTAFRTSLLMICLVLIFHWLLSPLCPLCSKHWIIWTFWGSLAISYKCYKTVVIPLLFLTVEFGVAVVLMIGEKHSWLSCLIWWAWGERWDTVNKGPKDIRGIDTELWNNIMNCLTPESSKWAGETPV